MLKDKPSNFKMKNDESIPETFYRLQVIINNLKSLGEKVKDEDFSQVLDAFAQEIQDIENYHL
jgi:hypothetical protein